ncbi:hypothetical protein [Vogesella indigofera]|uniref:hypothetical protein n=1 Tax=Vogesella indigofera TaxID=45465 RepID=UPI00234EF006|nr:hypothetical protein [Vogesella indigofera]MDC7700380.1 hypothetical protein [Vogesella indigofera]
MSTNHQTTISGRIGQVRKYEKYFYTEFLLPAADAYSQPGVVEVRSSARLGKTGDETECLVEISGYRGKPYRYTDEDTGEQITRRPVLNILNAVEA